MDKSQEKVNYEEYGYLGNEMISISAQNYFKLKEIVDQELSKNTTHSFPEKYMFVDKVTGKVVKKVTDANRDSVQKIVDVDNTMKATPSISRTPLGMQLLEIKFEMNQIHKNMVDSGVAKHIPTLQRQEEERKKALLSAPLAEDEQPEAQMSVVKDGETE